MVNKRLTRVRGCCRKGFDRVVWCREKRGGARTGNSRNPNKKPGLGTGLFVSIPGIGIPSGSFVRHGGVVTVGLDTGAPPAPTAPATQSWHRGAGPARGDATL